jgi:hypothetical protein
MCEKEGQMQGKVFCRYKEYGIFLKERFLYILLNPHVSYFFNGQNIVEEINNSTQGTFLLIPTSWSTYKLSFLWLTYFGKLFHKELFKN